MPRLAKGELDILRDSEGLEEEDVSSDDGSNAIIQPFDPTKIRVRMWNPTIQLLIERIRLGEINLGPEFQRAGCIWTHNAQSQLIESLLIRIPLPAFYFDATDEDNMVVIDGQQRLTTLKRFILDGTLKLSGLEFLTDYGDSDFTGLPRQLQRRILETQVTVFVIEKGAPSEVKYTIFKRINTTGLPLSSQEIRHALNQGEATRLLKELAESDAFRIATDGSVPPKRMVDRECVLRFLAFILSPWQEYAERDLDRFLNQTMVTINGLTKGDRSELRRRFERAMNAAFAIFSKDAFRKRYSLDSQRYPINKALFEAWSVNLDARTDQEHEILVERADKVKQLFMSKLSTDPPFEKSVSAGTGDPKNVRKRFSEMGKILNEALR
jgi:hypothetical protein